MTLQELSQLYYLKQEIERDIEKIRELELMAQPGAQKLSGMPRSPGVSDTVGKYAVKIADLKSAIENKHSRCLRERERLERYILEIDDSMLRLIFEYRFIDCLGWNAVALRIGGGNTAQSVKKACYRYLKKHP